MRSNLVPVIAAVIVFAFAGGVFYYWQGGGRSAQPVTGVVVDKFERLAGSEAGDKPLQQGLNVLKGKSLEKEVFYFVLVRTESGEQVEVEVPENLYTMAAVGDTVHRASPGALPTLTRQADANGGRL